MGVVVEARGMRTSGQDVEIKSQSYSAIARYNLIVLVNLIARCDSEMVWSWRQQQ